jgi:thymidylate synthase ThyX
VQGYVEPFTDDEVAVLSRFFTNVDRPVFALINMPEVVKGALFARYSRSAKSLRRLFLDEFVADPDAGIDAIVGGAEPGLDIDRAERLYQRVFVEYGDDSVAQLGAAHLAVEQGSNLLTKALEWGRLAAYLEQSTRYIPYDTRLGDRHRYVIPPEIQESPLRRRYVSWVGSLFEAYAELLSGMKEHYERRFPLPDGESPRPWAVSLRAKAFDAVRGVLPAATSSNVGVFASGQAWEMALVRMRAHPLAEVRHCADAMLVELRRVIPSFLRRVDVPDRGEAWTAYLADVRDRLDDIAAGLSDPDLEPGPSVALVGWDEDAETKVAAAALYPGSTLPDQYLLETVAAMTQAERAAVLAAAVGERANRRHKPGRAFERALYRFDIICDFGAFRDLQRHRMMTIEWQRLGSRLGHDTPPDILEAGMEGLWSGVMENACEIHHETEAALGADVAQYVLPLAFNIRFVMEMNAREAMHLIELRSQPAGHRAYRQVALEMHRAIEQVAGHRLIAGAMKYVDGSDVELERLEGERRAEQRRHALGA